MISLADEPDFRLAAWTVSPSTGELRRGDQIERLEPRVMRVLLCLVGARGGTVSRDRLMEEAWGRIVSDDAVVRCIVLLRALFNDDPSVQLSTVRKVGYRLTAGPQATPAAPGRWRRVAIGLAGLALLALVGWGMRALMVRTATPKVLEFTAEPGTKTYPSFDPSGERVAYSLQPDDNARTYIVVRPVSGASPTAFTRTASDDFAPVWSPDGASIAFLRRSPGDVACRLMVKPYPTGPEREFGRCGVRFTSMDWLKDGTGVVLSDRPNADQPYRLVRVGLDGARRDLTRPAVGANGDLAPKVSPDGRRVAFSRSLGLGLGDIHVLDLKTGRERRLTREGVTILSLAWSDDGRTLYFTSLRGQWGAIWAVGAGGGTPREVAPGLLHTSDLAQARGVLVAAVRARRLNLFERSPGGAERALPDPSVNSDWEPEVAEDGTLLFLSNRSGAIQVWTRKTGAAARQLTSLSHRLVTCPRWSPDGRSVLLLAGGPDGLDLATIPAGGGALKRLTDGPGYRRYPSWSADGKAIYFSVNQDGKGWRVWRISAQGGDAIPVTGPGWRAGRESPDGRWLYATQVDRPGLWRRPVSGGDFEPVTARLGPHDEGLWALRGDSIFYVTREVGAPPVIVQRSAVTGQERAVGAIPDLLNVFYSCYGLSVAPDGRLLYARMLRQESELYKVVLPR
jgi:Tol biopolymer transport system component/DNA-binding winged helix-turn-helix (wHTH) protein